MLWRELLYAILLVAVSGVPNARAQPSAAPTLTLSTLDGQKIRLRDLREKIVLVNFWATSCAICVAEMPDLVESYRQYHQRGLEIIAIAMPSDDPTVIKRYVAKNDLTFPVVWDSAGDVGRSFGGVSGTPTMFVIDKKGRLISKTVGAIDFTKLRRLLDNALN